MVVTLVLVPTESKTAMVLVCRLPAVRETGFGSLMMIVTVELALVLVTMSASMSAG